MISDMRKALRHDPVAGAFVVYLSIAYKKRLIEAIL